MQSERSPGPLGENTLRTWASEEGAIINRANDDRSGWDFILEFPNSSSGKADTEEQGESQYQCLIQVKSTDVGQQYSQIKLSNMKRLIETPLPTFILFLAFNGGRTCRNAHLVHIGEEYIARTLKRVRALVVNGEGELLHKRRLNVKWTLDDELSILTGAAMLAKVRSVIGPSLAGYSKRKLGILQTVGYGSGTAKATVKVLVPDGYRQRNPEELLVDAKLGLIRELDLAGGEMRTLRFGIPGKRTAEFGGGARLRIGLPTPNIVGELVFRTNDLEEIARLPSTVRGARSDAGLADGGIAKVRFELPFSHFVVSLPEGVGTFHFALPSDDERMDLESAMKLSRVLSVLQHASQIGGGVFVEFEGNPVAAFDVRDLPPIKPFFEWAKLVGAGYTALQDLGIAPAVDVTLQELAVQKDALQVICAARSQRIPEGTVFTFMVHEGVAPEPGEEMCFPISFDLALGKISVVVFLSIIGNVREEQSVTGEFVAPVTRIEVERIVQLDREMTLPKPRHEYLREVALARSSSMGVVCWWEERSNWQENGASD